MEENKKSLDELLEDIAVIDVDTDVVENVNIENWFAVANTEGIIAYFGNEADAYRFRLDYINRILNP